MNADLKETELRFIQIEITIITTVITLHTASPAVDQRKGFRLVQALPGYSPTNADPDAAVCNLELTLG